MVSRFSKASIFLVSTLQETISSYARKNILLKHYSFSEQEHLIKFSKLEIISQSIKREEGK